MHHQCAYRADFFMSLSLSLLLLLLYLYPSLRLHIVQGSQVVPE